ncbi:MAG: type II toxin-antitoxin system ParD family antitoxin [Planctomycetes bacterium]|nr:type II toxin-antitoxin system ParD family antitoxin [Planctomycetota bacterium]
MHLPADLQLFVDHQISTGIYESVDDVLTAALMLLRAQHDVELKTALDEGLRQLENGESIHLPDKQSRHEFFDRIKGGTWEPSSCPAQ